MSKPVKPSVTESFSTFSKSNALLIEIATNSETFREKFRPQRLKNPFSLSLILKTLIKSQAFLQFEVIVTEQ